MLWNWLREDVARWCAGLTEEEVEARPFGAGFGGVSVAAYCAESGSAADVCGGAAVE